jgi:hypothetical protein
MSGTECGMPRLRRSANSSGSFFRIRYGRQIVLPSMVDRQISFANSVTRSRNPSYKCWLNAHILNWSGRRYQYGLAPISKCLHPPPMEAFSSGGVAWQHQHGSKEHRGCKNSKHVNIRWFIWLGISGKSVVVEFFTIRRCLQTNCKR